MSIVYVNSTLRARAAMRRDGLVSPIHYWGYRPTADDVVLGHRLNRVEITLRARLAGVDPSILVRTGWHLWRGAGGLYLVTQPDLWRALPFLRRRFPSRRLVTWAWMDWEVDRHFDGLQACDHVLCLTEGAKRRLDARGLGARSSLAIWGCEPAHYRLSAPVTVDTDVLIAGLTARDVDLIKRTLALGRFTAFLASGSRSALGLDGRVGPAVTAAKIETEHDLVTAFHRCRVTWIPLQADDRYPSGYTNLIESLLCGTAVVIADSSSIPASVLSLPGVFRYRTGSVDDFTRRTDEALAFMRADGARAGVAATAAKHLDGAALARTIREQLQVEGSSR